MSTARSTRRSAADRVATVARDLFYWRGIRAVGVEEIVRDAGVAKPALYRSFASKDDLVCACLEAHLDELRRSWDSARDRSNSDPRRQLAILVEEQAAKVAAGRGCAVTNAAMEFPDLDHPTRAACLAIKREYRERMHALVGRLDVARPDMLADALILLLEGAGSSRHVFDGAGPAGVLVTAANALIDGMNPPANGH